jgi:hypothetical protein
LRADRPYSSRAPLRQTMGELRSGSYALKRFADPRDSGRSGSFDVGGEQQGGSASPSLTGGTGISSTGEFIRPNPHSARRPTPKDRAGIREGAGSDTPAKPPIRTPPETRLPRAAQSTSAVSPRSLRATRVKSYGVETPSLGHKRHGHSWLWAEDTPSGRRGGRTGGALGGRWASEPPR